MDTLSGVFSGDISSFNFGGFGNVRDSKDPILRGITRRRGWWDLSMEVGVYGGKDGMGVPVGVVFNSINGFANKMIGGKVIFPSVLEFYG
jgi:hypothetical protein